MTTSIGLTIFRIKLFVAAWHRGPRGQATIVAARDLARGAALAGAVAMAATAVLAAIT